MKKKREHRVLPWATLKKCLIMVKWSVFLFLLGIVQVFAVDSYSQQTRFSMKFEKTKLESVLNEIENQSNYYFLYNQEYVDVEQLVNIQVQDQKIDQLLSRLLESTGILFSIQNRQIVLTSRETQTQAVSRQSGITVSGKVTDSSGQPLPGVSVVLKGTTNGTITDFDGKYALANVPDNATLMFSFVGMKAQEVQVAGKPSINVKLEEESIGIEEVVAVGYGTMKKSDLTGSVSSVKGDDLTKVSAASVSTAIAGRLPGLQVTQNTGEPGAGSVLRMRGVGSVYSGTDPLVLIDGFEGSMNQVSPNDVESITLLKDAASASIYGSRAANGVVLITTKKGAQNQALKLEFNAQIGMQQATKIPELLDSPEWCRKMNQSTKARLGTEYWVGAQAPELQTTNNWLDYIFQTAPVQDYHISATGGAQKLRYSVNIGYFDQDGIIITGNYRRFSIRSNVDYISDRFSAGASVFQFRSWSSSKLSPESAMINALRTPPTIPVYNSDGLPGTPRSGYSGEEIIMDNTPSMDAISREYSKTGNSSTVNLYAELKLLNGLKYKTVFNVSTSDSYDQTFSPTWSSYRPNDTEHVAVYKGSSLSKMSVNDYTNYLWEVQNLLTYTKDIKKHHVDVLAGMSAQKYNSSSIYAYREKFPRNNLTSLSAGGDNPDASGSTSTGSLESQFGRVNYSYSNKYLVQFNVRRDGSSVFAPKNRYGIFPSASIGWRISEEEFLKDNPVISNMKLRAGIGSLGNSNIPSYKWLSTISFNAGYVLGANQELNAGATVSGAYNEKISWETTTTTNIGLDLSLYKNKFNLSFEVFKRKTTDMLLLLPLPSTTGYSSNPYVNIGGVNNQGWEFTGEYNNRFNELKYSVSFNVTHVNNEVVDMGGVKPIIDNFSRTEEGQAISSFYGYEVEGIYQSTEDIANSPSFSGAKPGDFKYKDLDKSGTITADDRTFLGNAIPKFYYGGNINLSWRAFDLSVQVQGEYKKKIMVEPIFGMDFGALYDYANMFKEAYEDRWTKEGDNSYYPALGSGIRGINNSCNTRWLQDAGYMRVKSIHLGYTLPKHLFSILPIDNLRVFLTGTNLFTFSNYIGFDPEMGTRQKRSDSTGYMDKVYTRGGSDYPQAKTLQVGVNIVF